MEGGSYAAHQELRGRRQAEEEKAGAGRQPRAAEGAGGMKFRVSARAPHGVGALLLIGGAVLTGAAVVAWRHARRGKGDRRPAKHEASDGGVVEDGKGGASAPEIDQPDDNVQGGASPRRIDGHDDDNLRGEEEKTEIGPNGLDNGGMTEEIQEVHGDAEIVGDESNSELVEKIDLDSRSSPAEISTHDDVNSELVEEIGLHSRSSPAEISTHDDVDSEPVEKVYQDSSTKLPEINAHDMDSIILVEKADEISVKNDTENDHNPTKDDDTENDQDGIKYGAENENSSKNDLKKEIVPNVQDNEDVEASDQSNSHSISRPGIVLDKQNLHGGGTQEAESMENSPTAKLMMHREQLLDDMTTDSEGETGEAEPGEGTALDNDMREQGQRKATAEPVALAGSPALSSPDKLAERKEPELTGLPALSPLDKLVEKKEPELAGSPALSSLDKLAERKEPELAGSPALSSLDKLAERKGPELTGSPALSSLDKLAEKKEPALPGRIETGMKMEQERANGGGVKEHGLITKGGAAPGGGAVVTMDRSMAILALLFALAIGVAIVVRLYAPRRAAKLEMDMQ